MSKELDKSMTFLLRHYIFHTVGVDENSILDVVESIHQTLLNHYGYTGTELERYYKKQVYPLLNELCVVLQVPEDEREDTYFGNVDLARLQEMIKETNVSHGKAISSGIMRCCFCCAEYDGCTRGGVGDSGCPGH